MSFVPVSPGDLFLIGPGTPHAIGKGVLLLEPQRVAPGGQRKSRSMVSEVVKKCSSLMNGHNLNV